MLQIYSSENVGMVPVERANFVTAFGMCMMFGGPLVKRTIGMFGMIGMIDVMDMVDMKYD